MSQPHPRRDLDPVFTNPLRFSLMALLAGVERMNFRDARDYLETTDSTLSKHASALETAGYLQVRKLFRGKKPLTSYSLSTAGLQAWRSHLAALRAIAANEP